ncbi:geranylgeranyl transferase type-1 subunit beta isoform X2 [Anthonomus grandis grandis]|uniref:geranylgeranyl transferase type-1 subunit beta isoform X2 n=1 Tax=Anthonomus grandis grandis TaxID=2921223 RepID=UPI002166BFDF|nr:geranylgeranyl transferase type-1 subunit beta isoform X2 [Anthonomus grandis grandis]
MEAMPRLEFERDLHKKFLNRFLHARIPSYLANLDTNRAVIMFFCVAGLDVLSEIQNIDVECKEQMINWLYSLQVDSEPYSGFQGSSTLNTAENQGIDAPYKWGHIATTYSALLALLILGDDLSKIKKDKIISSLKALQLPDGSFKAAIEGTENDMRFVFCAACISYILNDWSGIDLERMVDFILKSISYDGGIGQGPSLESHCGSTFCALASLALSNNLNRLSISQTRNLKRWLLFRLETGFNGRPNKPTDTCYSFWTGGSLQILNAYQFIESDENPSFVLMTQDKYGGFAKWMTRLRCFTEFLGETQKKLQNLV